MEQAWRAEAGGDEAVGCTPPAPVPLPLSPDGNSPRRWPRSCLVGRAAGQQLERSVPDMEEVDPGS